MAKCNFQLIIAVCAVTLLGASFVPTRAQESDEDHKGPPGPTPALVHIAPLTRRTVQDRLAVIGRLQVVRRSVVASERSGRVTGVSVEEGDNVVAARTVLAQIDDTWARLDLRDAEAQLDQANARIDQTNANLEQAQRNRERMGGLYEQQSAQLKELQDAQTLVKVVQARLAGDKAAAQATQVRLDRVKSEMDKLTIRAPFDGAVVRKIIEVGQWAQEGAAVVEVVSCGAIDAQVNVPEALVNLLKVGDDLDIWVEPLGRTVTGKVTAIVPEASTAARTFPVKVRLGNAAGQLMAGMSVRARVPTGKSVEALTAPRDAVLRTADGTVVWVAAASPHGPMPVAQRVPVRVLFAVDDRYVIDPARAAVIDDDAQVVIEGAERLVPGQPLIVQGQPTARSE